MQFEHIALDDRLQRAVAAAGFTQTTAIQAVAIPAGLEGRDLIGTAQTGTGKTAAFVLPILHSLLTTPVTTKRRRTRALIVTPTRELAEQIHAAVRQLAQFTNIKSATVYGGMGMEPQTRALRNGTDIIVACPGRLLDHLSRGHADLRAVQTLVLDEADRMLDMGFLPDVRRIVSHTPEQRQTMLFSATFARELNQLATEILRAPKRLEMGRAAPPETIAHMLCPVAHERKTDLLLRLLDRANTRSVLIFTRTKHRANRLAKKVSSSGFTTAVLHSNRSQNQRQKALDGFRSGKFQMLVATDIAARGLDVETISHVINYDIPNTADDYIHRLGRTGRAERSGDALTLVTTDDSSTVRDIERALGKSIPLHRIDGFDYSIPIAAANIDPRVRRSTARPAAFRSTGAGPNGPGRRPARRATTQR